jgi:hypothetical protein
MTKRAKRGDQVQPPDPAPNLDVSDMLTGIHKNLSSAAFNVNLMLTKRALRAGLVDACILNVEDSLLKLQSLHTMLYQKGAS